MPAFPARGRQRGGGKGFDSPFSGFFSRVGPHHPTRQTLLAKLSLLLGLTSTFRSRCGQHVCSFFFHTAASRRVEPRRARRGVRSPRQIPFPVPIYPSYGYREGSFSGARRPLHQLGSPTKRVVPLLKRSRRPPAHSAFGASATQQVIGETVLPLVQWR